MDLNHLAERNTSRSTEGRVKELLRSMPLLPASWRRLGYYGLALLLVAIGATVRWMLTRLVGPGLPVYVTFYPAVILAALIGGWGPGVLATLATALFADYWLLPPPGFKIESRVDVVGLVLFSIISALMSVVAELYRRIRDHLAELVIARTAGLNQANRQLQEQTEKLQVQTEELAAANEGLHKSEQTLRESEEKYRRIVETATEGIVMVDTEARIVLANDRWSEIFGYTLEEARCMGQIDLVFSEDIAQATERWASPRQGRREDFEFRFRRKDGRPIWGLVSAAPRFGPEGQLLGALVMIADITARKQAEEALRELNTTLESKVTQRTAELEHRARQLQEAWDQVRRETEARIAALEQLRHEDRLKTIGRLASGIAHELGTPLNVISGYAGMIAGGNLSAHESLESAQTIKAQSERIATIVRQLLDFARRRPGQKGAVDLRQLIRQTLDLMVPLARKQSVRLIQADGGAAVVARADAEQIKQVLLNLVTNAVQALPGGGDVEVAAGPAPGRPPAGHADPDGQYVCISVQDQGEGISEENLSHIFEPFFTTKGPGKGTGLGLSVAEGIVREHGGWITVESTRGKGSCFWVCLPKEGQTCRDES